MMLKIYKEITYNMAEDKAGVEHVQNPIWDIFEAPVEDTSIERYTDI